VLTDDLIRAAMKAEKDSKKKRLDAGEELNEAFDLEEEDDTEDSEAKKPKHKTQSPKKNPKNKKKTGSK
jgi:hypothetical protein